MIPLIQVLRTVGSLGSRQGLGFRAFGISQLREPRVGHFRVLRCRISGGRANATSTEVLLLGMGYRLDPKV